jgi:cystathionine gamma-synthase/methionine-gamma-lyase
VTTEPTAERGAPWRLATSLVHAGERAAPPAATPTATPIYTSATYLYPTLDALDAAFETGDGYVYTRYGNPTVAAFEQAVATAERGIGATAFGSGMAALHAALLAAGTPRGETAPRPRSILMARDAYGSTLRLVEELFMPRGAAVTCCDMTDMAAVEQAFDRAQPDVVLVEQLSNPLLRVADVAALAQRARAAGARLVVDNTIATPVLQQPLALGADLVVHSATKYLGGHGDAAGGVVVARSGLLRDTLARQSRLLGASLGPFEAQQLLRGLKTLSLRLERQCANALRVSNWLAEHPAVLQVCYPGLATHPQHELACQALGGRFGALMTFTLRGEGRDALRRFFGALRLILPASSLGDVYTMATAPVVSSHRDLTPDERTARGICETMVRLSVGIEAPEDIVADLQGALAACA